MNPVLLLGSIISFNYFSSNNGVERQLTGIITYIGRYGITAKVGNVDYSLRYRNHVIKVLQYPVKPDGTICTEKELPYYFPEYFI